MATGKNEHMKGLTVASAVTDVPATSYTHWHGNTSPYDDHSDSIMTMSCGGGRCAPSKPRNSNISSFGRTWSCMSSALRDLELIWTRRREEAARPHWSRPYMPSIYSSQTMGDDYTAVLALRWDDNHIINRLSNIEEDS